MNGHKRFIDIACNLVIKCLRLINETAVENPTPNTEAVEKSFKDFLKSVENRLLAIEDRLIGANLDVKSVENSSEEKDICFKISTNRVSELERQILDHNVVITLCVCLGLSHNYP